MPTPTKTPTRPEIERPPCPGCPDPDNARRVDAPCPGPDRIKDPFPDDQANKSELDQLSRALGAPACADLIFCPRTRGYTLS